MRYNSVHATRRWWFRIFAVLLFAIGWIGSAQAVLGQDVGAVVRIEEDWEMTVATPDANTTGPQVTCITSPAGNISGLHAAFSLNHRPQPNFASGGLQLQVWNGDTLVNISQPPQASVMSTANETVRWTQVMQISGGVLSWEVLNGTSATWGSFGGLGTLKVQVPSGLTNLGAYNPNVSVQFSGAGFAGNRVQSLVLKRVRTITQSGTVIEDDTPRSVQVGD